MQDKPPAADLVAEVRRLLEAGAPPGFAQRVAANALGIALREIEDGPAMAAAEMARLSALVGDAGDLAQRNARLARDIREGRRGAHDAALIDHLIRTSTEKLAIDQPAYPAYRAWRAAHGEEE